MKMIIYISHIDPDNSVVIDREKAGRRVSGDD